MSNLRESIAIILMSHFSIMDEDLKKKEKKEKKEKKRREKNK